MAHNDWPHQHRGRKDWGALVPSCDTWYRWHQECRARIWQSWFIQAWARLLVRWWGTICAPYVDNGRSWQLHTLSDQTPYSARRQHRQSDWYDPAGRFRDLSNGDVQLVPPGHRGVLWCIQGRPAWVFAHYWEYVRRACHRARNPVIECCRLLPWAMRPSWPWNC